MKKNEMLLLYSTFPDREKALSTARNLLEKKLIACANVYAGVTSLYRWEGAVCEEPESVLIVKTSSENEEAAIAAIKKQHPYDIPCIVTLPVTGGLPAFIQWVVDETAA